jgi:methyltransferase (TIGR00027 family)
MACGEVDHIVDSNRNAKSWEEEKKFRYSCEHLTSMLREQVPVLDFVKWHIKSIDQGSVNTVLPLINPSTNQHCTHQGALLFLAAEYTGGIALASLIHNHPVVGVHPVGPSEKSMALWLGKGDIKYVRPSVGCLDIIAEVSPDRHEKIRKRYAQGKVILERITINFKNGSTVVAEAEMTYYIRQSDMLRSDGVSPDKVSILYQHKLVSSAELIAGVRANESGGLFEDPYSEKIAGEHGRALANRFCEKSPQLGGMVAARTKHLDMRLENFLQNGGRNVVLLGTGYDMRIFRLKIPAGTSVYELDFPTVLIDRQNRLDEFAIDDPDGVDRIPLPIDLRTTTLAAILKDQVDFDSPIFVAWEGVSMYFHEPEVRTILQGILPVFKNPESRLWVDFIHEAAVVNPDIYPEVKAFMQGMQLLGEPFVFGPKSIEDFMNSNGFQCNEVVRSDVFMPHNTDPIYSIYNFCTASAAVAQPTTTDSREITPQALHPAHAIPAPLDTDARKTISS